MSDSRVIPIFRATVDQEGQLKILDLSRWRGYLARLKGREVSVRVDLERAGRSLKANAYLWGVCYAILAEWSGHEREEIHEAMKGRFLRGRRVVLPNGEVMEVAGSTKDLDSAGFAEFVQKVKRFAAENGCYIPEPDEVDVTL